MKTYDVHFNDANDSNSKWSKKVDTHTTRKA